MSTPIPGASLPPEPEDVLEETLFDLRAHRNFRLELHLRPALLLDDLAGVLDLKRPQRQVTEGSGWHLQPNLT